MIDEVRRELPKADRRTRCERQLRKVLRAAAERAEVLGIGGGDGTVACAAAVAVDAGRPLAVFPAGTFNHFAKDIGPRLQGCVRPWDETRCAAVLRRPYRSRE